MNKYIQDIIDNLGQYDITKIIGDVWIERHKYLHVLQNQYRNLENVLIPYTGGTWATAISYDSYEYTHGGRIYQFAVQKCHELQEKGELQ